MIKMYFLPCSCLIGLEISGMYNTNCILCEYHSDISQYRTDVIAIQDHLSNSTASIHAEPAWISYINDTDLTGYLVYPNCTSFWLINQSTILPQQSAKCSWCSMCLQPVISVVWILSIYYGLWNWNLLLSRKERRKGSQAPSASPYFSISVVYPLYR